MFGAKREGEYVLLWTLSDKRSVWFTDLPAAAEYVEANKARDVYVGVTCSREDYGPERRLKIDGGERMPTSMMGVYADLDIRDSGHRKQNLPPDEAAARTILFHELPPSILIHTGGGLQAWWTFREPWELGDAAEVEKASALSKRWIRALRANAAAKGWDVDQVGDLTRVLRVPGTSNCKIPGEPRLVTIREINERAYNPSDLEEYLDIIGAARTDAPKAVSVSVGRLAYDPAAVVDMGRFDLLCQAEPKLKRCWEHARTEREFPDQSASSYDQAIANIAAAAGWPDQEICNLLIAHRRKYSFDLKMRDSYYGATIRKARELAGEVVLWEGVGEVLAEQHEARKLAAVPDDRKRPEETSPPAPEPKVTHAQTAMKALDHVSGLIGVRIIQIYKYLGEQPSYRLKCECGEIEMGNVQALTVQGNFRDAVAALANHRIPDFKPKEWSNVSSLLLGAVTAVELGPEAKTDEMIRAWIDQYLEGLAIMDSAADADSVRGPFWSDTYDAVCFYLAPFQRWVSTNRGADNVSTPTMLRAFKRLKIETGTARVGTAGRNIYRMPRDYKPPQRAPYAEPVDAPGWVNAPTETEETVN